MPDFNAVTPALYAISQEISYRAAEENAKTVKGILEQEAEIYRIAFRTYSFSREIKANKGLGRSIFFLALHDRLEARDEEVLHSFGRPVYDEYWRMAQCEQYWRDGGHARRDGLLDFPKILELWKTDREKELREADFFLGRLVDGVLHG